MIAPHHDCPACPTCKAPCGTRDGEAIPDGHLRCASCGVDWLAMPGETAQALASDAAWERLAAGVDPKLVRKVGAVRLHENALRQLPLFAAALTPDNPT